MKAASKLPGRTAWKLPPNTPVAFVNGEPIRVAEWVDRMSLMIGSQALDSLIQESLVRQEARKQGVRVTPAEVDERVTDELKRLRAQLGTEQRYKLFLKNSRMSEAGLRAVGRERLEVRMLSDKLRDKVTTSVKVSDEEVAQAYEAQKFAYQLPDEAQVRQILVAVTGTDPQADAAAKMKAEQLLTRAKGMTAQQFADLAKESSEDADTKAKGGELPALRKPSMLGPQFDNAVFNASPGLLPQPVRSFRGYHVVYLIDRKPARTRTLEEVKEQLREQLLTRKRTEQFTKYMADLQQNAKQDVRLQF